MEEFHKDLAILHFHRLKRVLAEDDDDAIARYTNKDAAREQLARMTLVIRDHVAHRARGEIEENAIESMIIDVVDASFFASGKERTVSNCKDRLRSCTSTDQSPFPRSSRNPFSPIRFLPVGSMRWLL